MCYHLYWNPTNEMRTHKSNKKIYKTKTEKHYESLVKDVKED